MAKLPVQFAVPFNLRLLAIFLIPSSTFSKIFTRRSLQPPTARAGDRNPQHHPVGPRTSTKIVKAQGTGTPGRARPNAQKYSGVLEQPWNSHPSRCPKRDRYAARRSGTKHQVSQENRTHCRQGAEAASVIHIIGNTGKKKHFENTKTRLCSAPSGRHGAPWP